MKQYISIDKSLGKSDQHIIFTNKNNQFTGTFKIEVDGQDEAQNITEVFASKKDVQDVQDSIVPSLYKPMAQVEDGKILLNDNVSTYTINDVGTYTIDSSKLNIPENYAIHFTLYVDSLNASEITIPEAVLIGIPRNIDRIDDEGYTLEDVKNKLNNLITALNDGGQDKVDSCSIEMVNGKKYIFEYTSYDKGQTWFYELKGIIKPNDTHIYVKTIDEDGVFRDI